MQTVVLEELVSGNLRPRRIYEKTWRASGCGRMLTNIKDDQKVVFVTPGSVLMTTDEGIGKAAKQLGIVVHKMEKLDRKTLNKELEFAPSMGLRRAIRWTIGR